MQRSTAAHRLYSTAQHSFDDFTRPDVVAVETAVAPVMAAQLYLVLIVSIMALQPSV